MRVVPNTNSSGVVTARCRAEPDRFGAADFDMSFYVTSISAYKTDYTCKQHVYMSMCIPYTHACVSPFQTPLPDKSFQPSTSCTTPTSTSQNIMLLFVYACLFVCMPIMHVCLSVCLPACLPGWLAVCLSGCIYVCLLACLFVCLFVCLSMCLFVYLFVRLFVGCFLCMRACMYVCMTYLFTYTDADTHTHFSYLHTCLYNLVCTYICIHICMYTCKEKSIHAYHAYNITDGLRLRRL